MQVRSTQIPLPERWQPAAPHRARSVLPQKVLVHQVLLVSFLRLQLPHRSETLLHPEDSARSRMPLVVRTAVGEGLEPSRCPRKGNWREPKRMPKTYISLLDTPNPLVNGLVVTLLNCAKGNAQVGRCNW